MNSDDNFTLQLSDLKKEVSRGMQLLDTCVTQIAQAKWILSTVDKSLTFIQKEHSDCSSALRHSSESSFEKTPKKTVSDPPPRSTYKGSKIREKEEVQIINKAATTTKVPPVHRVGPKSKTQQIVQEEEPKKTELSQKEIIRDKSPPPPPPPSGNSSKNERSKRGDSENSKFSTNTEEKAEKDAPKTKFPLPKKYAIVIHQTECSVSLRDIWPYLPHGASSSIDLNKLNNYSCPPLPMPSNLKFKPTVTVTKIEKPKPIGLASKKFFEAIVNDGDGNLIGGRPGPKSKKIQNLNLSAPPPKNPKVDEGAKKIKLSEESNVKTVEKESKTKKVSKEENSDSDGSYDFNFANVPSTNKNPLSHSSKKKEKNKKSKFVKYSTSSEDESRSRKRKGLLYKKTKKIESSESESDEKYRAKKKKKEKRRRSDSSSSKNRKNSTSSHHNSSHSRKSSFTGGSKEINNGGESDASKKSVTKSETGSVTKISSSSVAKSNSGSVSEIPKVTKPYRPGPASVMKAQLLAHNKELSQETPSQNKQNDQIPNAKTEINDKNSNCTENVPPKAPPPDSKNVLIDKLRMDPKQMAALKAKLIAIKKSQSGTNESTISNSQSSAEGGAKKDDVSATNEKIDGSVISTNEKIDGSVISTNERIDGSVISTNEKRDGSVISTNEKRDESQISTNEGGGGMGGVLANENKGDAKNDFEEEGSIELGADVIGNVMNNLSESEETVIIEPGGRTPPPFTIRSPPTLQDCINPDDLAKFFPSLSRRESREEERSGDESSSSGRSDKTKVLDVGGITVAHGEESGGKIRDRVLYFLRTHFVTQEKNGLSWLSHQEKMDGIFSVMVHPNSAEKETNETEMEDNLWYLIDGIHLGKAVCTDTVQLVDWDSVPDVKILKMLTILQNIKKEK